MIRNHLRTAYHNIKRYSAHSILNISGMAIGMTCAFLILLWVQDELSYDRYHKNADELYRVLENQHINGGALYQVATTPTPLPATLKEQYPEIVRSSYYLTLPIPIKKEDEYINEVVAIADIDFLEMFNIQFVRGDIKNSLIGSQDMIITEEMAKKYFNNEDPLGKTLTPGGFTFTITGVVKSMPRNSHLHFDFLVPTASLKQLGVSMNDWEYVIGYSYIELKEGVDSKLIEKKIKDIVQRNSKGSNTEIFLQNVQKIHLFSSGKYIKDIDGLGDIKYVRILSIIAIFILIIACINFMNLATAQSAIRAKEIGVRKVVGANRGKIIFQFLSESLLIVLVSTIIAMVFIELLLPGFNNLTGKTLHLNYLHSSLYIGLLTVILFCTLLAGSYPAIYLSSLRPFDTLKGNISRNPGNAGFRKVLVIFQFSLSIVLIICTLIVGNQLKYLRNKNLGLNISNIGYFPFNIGIHGDVLKKELRNIPDIVSVTIAGENALDIKGTVKGFDWEGNKRGDEVLFNLLRADLDYAKTFQLELKEGRFFSDEFPSDTNAIVINEQATKLLGFKDPVGEILSYNGLKFTIIGVIKDFHFKSLHTKIDPLIIISRSPDGMCYVRTRSGQIASVIDDIKKIFKSYNLPYPLDFKFLDDYYDNLYRREQIISKLFRYFALLAIIISCLGLIGLSSFMMERRTKEIAIRKSNGAASSEIFTMLSKEYLVLAVISFFIAIPLAWHFMNKWLQIFAYRITVKIWMFGLAGVIVFIVTLLTVSFQSYKAASKNPVEGLKNE